MQDQEASRTQTIEPSAVVPMNLDRLSEALASGLAATIDWELLLMRNALGKEAFDEDFQALHEQSRSCVAELRDLLRERRIRPWQHVRLDPEDPLADQQPSGERPLRLGFFPTAANPLHWMHLLGGLSAIVRFHLDKVIYIIAGKDPRKSDLLPAALRHRMGREVLRAFSPFLAYSPISLGSSLPGEVNVFRLLQLNAARKIQAFYLAGTDHCRHFKPGTEEPDTLQRLEDGVRMRLFGFDERRHRLSVILLDRGDPGTPVDTFLEVQRIERLPLDMSSTRIRDAFGGRCSPRVLAGIPFSVFSRICALELYGVSRLPMEEHVHGVAAPHQPKSTGADVLLSGTASCDYTRIVPSAAYTVAAGAYRSR